MKEYVDVEVLKQQDFQDFSITDVLYAIDHCPRVAVEPVRHAHWIKVEKYPPFYKCSNCNVWVKPQSYFIQIFSFCPNCGAKMDGKE